MSKQSNCSVLEGELRPQLDGLVETRFVEFESAGVDGE